MGKERLDALLVVRGLAGTVDEARRLILSGIIYSGVKCLDKPGQSVSSGTELCIKHRKEHGWVSRGGIKLAHALDHFHIDPSGEVAMDIGASTGGFTDVLLARGARKVYSVDVGYGELAWKLQRDGRVVVLERTNARYLTSSEMPEMAGIIVCDASFISLARILPRPLSFAKPGAFLIALIKPQFEAEKREVEDGGVVRDESVRERVCAAVSLWLAGQPGWRVLGVVESPIAGAEGNKEFFIGGRYDRDIRPDHN